ncbi:hypothetical protein GCM10014719_41520 [Planomonospora parontospora subsp. antibiotica]|nr:hypothetical protein GCM10014719_41520 [Planomonospora parontospora subsp. antibiotica]GII17411.1 hypothetical protein Ppa05_41370 [Planomonospora parontospora subsp. antibiotica]
MKIDPKITSSTIGKEKVKITASFSRKNIRVSKAARDSPTLITEGGPADAGTGAGAGAGAGAAEEGATVSLMGIGSPSSAYGGRRMRPAGESAGCSSGGGVCGALVRGAGRPSGEEPEVSLR